MKYQDSEEKKLIGKVIIRIGTGNVEHWKEASGVTVFLLIFDVSVVGK